MIHTLPSGILVIKNEHGICLCMDDTLQKSFSSELASKYPAGRWITISDSSSPLAGRHIFIVDHKGGTATVVAGGGPAMRHKQLALRRTDPGKADKKEEAAKKEEKKELPPERKQELETAKEETKTAIKEEKKKQVEFIRQHLGKELEITPDEKKEIEKKLENIEGKKKQAIARLTETNKLLKQKRDDLYQIEKMAKQYIVDDTPLAEGAPSISAVVKEHAQELLEMSYNIHSLERQNKQLSQMLKTGNERKRVSDIVTYAPITIEELEGAVSNEAQRDRELAAHYRLIVAAKGYVDESGQAHQPKGGEILNRNFTHGGYEALTGIMGEVTGNSIMTRKTYDIIGADNAAVLAHYYLKNSGHASKETKEKLNREFEKLGNEVVHRAIEKGDRFLDRARKVAATGGTLMEVAQAQGAAARHSNKAYECYGQSEGALNQAAELAYELQHDKGHVELVSKNTDALKHKAKKLGLKPQEYKISTHGDSHTLIIDPAHFEKLLEETPTDKNSMAAEDSISAIKSWRANTDGFLPSGIKDYTAPDHNGVQKKVELVDGKQAAVRFIAKQKKVYLNYEAGTGKSLIALAAKSHIEDETGKQVKMIVGMPGQGGALLHNFATEVEKFTDYKVAVIEASDSKAQRRAKYNSGPDTIVIVNYEKFNFDKDDIKNANFDMVVADEAHEATQREGSKKSQKSEGLKEAGLQAPYYVAMSGTPVPADLGQLYFHAHIMNPDKFPNMKEFMAKYGHLHQGEGFKEQAAAFMNRELHDHVITAKTATPKKADGSDVEFSVKTLWTPLTDAQKAEYKEAMKDAKGKGMSPDMLSNRFKEVLNNFDYKENGKFGKIKEIIDDHLKTKDPTEKISIFADTYKAADNVQRFLMEHYPEMGIMRFANKEFDETGTGNGRAYKAKEKLGRVEKFKQDRNIRFAIHTKVGATGLNIQHDGTGGTTKIIHLGSGMPSYALFDQMNRRGYRTGATRDVQAFNVLSDTPFDMNTDDRLDSKKIIQNLIKALIPRRLLRAHN